MKIKLNGEEIKKFIQMDQYKMVTEICMQAFNNYRVAIEKSVEDTAFSVIQKEIKDFKKEDLKNIVKADIKEGYIEVKDDEPKEDKPADIVDITGKPLRNDK
jgi:phage terminase small subunit